MPKINIISLGCSRNQLDAEVMAGLVKKGGFTLTDKASGADICIVNTCAFIQSAREESVGEILEAARLKKEGRIKYLVVCGCLPQLYKGKLAAELREADLILGTSDFPKLPELLKKIGAPAARSVISREPGYLYDETSPRLLSTPPHYAYLKISEGCSNFCSYCIISRLRGAFRSRSIRSVTEEAKALAKSGRLKELIIIGQDTTLFGIDRYGKAVPGDLLRRLCAIDSNIQWIRILYTHPAHYTDDFISAVAEEKKICKYLDLPIQHISDRILKKMNRRVSKKDIIGLIAKLKKKIPGLVLRTSIIVGFPGETDKEFKELLDFMKDVRFNRLGSFIYSREESTRAARFDKQVPDDVKRERLDELMKLQQSISQSLNRKCLGKTVEVLVDEAAEGERGQFLARTQGDAPEIDGVVYLSGKNIKAGDICKAKIVDTLEYDLVGKKI